MEWVPKPGLLEKDAVAAAQQADVVLAFVGLSPELEGEEMPIHIEGFSGGDRTDIKLPAAQQHLLEAVAATGKPLVVVLMNGSALAVQWAQQHANAVLEAWYPGEAGAAAIAETLSGKNNPAGRLPVTFYASVDQLPAFTDYSMANRTYRYFKGTPLYGFGYGLSYTTFAYSKYSSVHQHPQSGRHADRRGRCKEHRHTRRRRSRGAISHSSPHQCLAQPRLSRFQASPSCARRDQASRLPAGSRAHSLKSTIRALER